MAKPSFRKNFRLFLFLFWGSVVIWMIIQMQAKGFNESILQSDSGIVVKNSSDFIQFVPNSSDSNISSTHIIFYPGALVQPEAYAPYARILAEQGYEVLIQKVPFRLAFTEGLEKSVFTKTIDIINSHSDSTKWVLAGHSKGGAMASEFAGEYPDKLSGLLLIGTSHPRRIDLTSLDIPITKVYASEDGLASVEEVQKFSGNLPHHTNFVLVHGGNHSQFGYYGVQLGSGTATISREKQQQQLVMASLELLLNL